MPVPLMMPAIHSMWLAARPSRTALMMGMPPATAASKATITPLLLRGAEDLVAVQRDQRLVGGDHMLAVGDRLQHQLARRRVTADQLDDDVDLGIVDHRERIIGDLDLVQPSHLLRIVGPRRRMGDSDSAAGTAGDLRGVARQHVDRAAADRTQPQQPDIDRFHGIILLNSIFQIRSVQPTAFSRPSLRNMSRMPRTAWRVRCSFSISPKRTWSSPYSPKPIPGDTATLASASSFLRKLQRAHLPVRLGIGAQTNMVAFGRSTAQPM